MPPFRPFGGEIGKNEAQVGIVDQQVLGIDRQPVAQRRRFRRLQVGEAHAHEIGVLAYFFGERFEQHLKACAQPCEPQAQPIRVDRVFDVHRCGTEMDLAAADRRLRRKDANLGHEIVMDLAFHLERRVDVDATGVRTQIVQFRRSDQPFRALRLRQRHPHRAPQPPARPFGEKRAKCRATVSPRERRGIRTIVHGSSSRSAPRRWSPVTRHKGVWLRVRD
jgi:hypothetical protein